MEPITIVLFSVISCLFVTTCVPNSIANARPRAMRRLVTCLIGLETLFALAIAAFRLVGDSTPASMRLVEMLPAYGIDVGVYLDGAASLMLLLVAFVGFVVSCFSVRYLDGEAAQGRYYRWLSFTIAAVSLMVIAGNLVLFFLAWVMTSLGLHQLLLHYGDRHAAQRAAWTKFAISRLGDVFLIAALALTFRNFGTFDFSTLFAQSQKLLSGGQILTAHAAIAWLLMLGAVTKSAQFPFHIWLPDTMETPTPVSALMHAGIVNAGGYLVIRTSPLLTLAPDAMLALAVIGAFTACFAGVIMMTQPSIKRSLAYSTISQMGFMMLQCGLGAFSAAMVHIVAHSLYKAHAFLTSGSAISHLRTKAGASSFHPSRKTAIVSLWCVSAAALTAYAAVLFTPGINFSAKPGGFVLTFILVMALATWTWQLTASSNRSATLIGLAGMAGLSLAYVATFLMINHVMQPVIPTIDLGPIWQFALAGITALFSAMFGLYALLSRRVPPAWLAPFRVHAANGFYIDDVYRCIFSAVTRA